MPCGFAGDSPAPGNAMAIAAQIVCWRRCYEWIPPPHLDYGHHSIKTFGDWRDKQLTVNSTGIRVTRASAEHAHGLTVAGAPPLPAIRVGEGERGPLDPGRGVAQGAGPIFLGVAPTSTSAIPPRISDLWVPASYGLLTR